MFSSGLVGKTHQPVIGCLEAKTAFESIEAKIFIQALHFLVSFGWFFPSDVLILLPGGSFLANSCFLPQSWFFVEKWDGPPI